MKGPFVLAHVFATDRFIMCRGMDCLHATAPSVVGEQAFIAEPASTQWIGEHLRRALKTAQPSDRSILYDEAEGSRTKQLGLAREAALLKDIADEFGYRNGKATIAKAFIVSAHCQLHQPMGLKLYATNHTRAGGYGPLANEPKHKDKFIRVDLELGGDAEIGKAVRDMLAISTISGKANFAL